MEETDKLVLRLVCRGQVELLKDFLKHTPPNFSWRNCINKKTGDCSLHLAAREGLVDIMRFLHKNGEMSLEQTNFDGKRPLHDAAQFSRVDCVEYLLQNGVEVDPLKRADWTPLMLACTKDNELIVRLLVEKGASTVLRNKDGWNCFHLACREGYPRIVSYLLDTKSTLWQTVSKNGRTPLHTAALYGKKEVVEMLIDRGEFSKNIMDSCGSTPLMDALRGGHLDVARCLIRKDICSLECRDKLGRTPIHIAAQAGQMNSLVFLLNECDCDPNTSTEDGLRALHFASREGHTQIINYLIQIGADESLQDKQGRTAYTIAKEHGRLDCLNVFGLGNK